jgi:hypothetical protein
VIVLCGLSNGHCCFFVFCSWLPVVFETLIAHIPQADPLVREKEVKFLQEQVCIIIISPLAAAPNSSSITLLQIIQVSYPLPVLLLLL